MAARVKGARNHAGGSSRPKGGRPEQSAHHDPQQQRHRGRPAVHARPEEGCRQHHGQRRHGHRGHFLDINQHALLPPQQQRRGRHADQQRRQARPAAAADHVGFAHRPQQQVLGDVDRPERRGGVEHAAHHAHRRGHHRRDRQSPAQRPQEPLGRKHRVDQPQAGPLRRYRADVVRAEPGEGHQSGQHQHRRQQHLQQAGADDAHLGVPLAPRPQVCARRSIGCRRRSPPRP